MGAIITLVTYYVVPTTQISGTENEPPQTPDFPKYVTPRLAPGYGPQCGLVPDLKGTKRKCCPDEATRPVLKYSEKRPYEKSSKFAKAPNALICVPA